MATDLIDAYNHCPICGSADLLREATARFCGKCGHREFNNPITAVAVFILDREDRVLLIRRAKDPAMGKWAPPGGFVDGNESLEQAATREISEEVGLKMNNLQYLASFPNYYVYRGLRRPVCDAFFTARADSFDVVLQQEEAGAYELRPLAEIDPFELAFESMRQALAVLRHSFH